MADARLAQLEVLYRSEYRRFLRVALAVLRDEERAVDATELQPPALAEEPTHGAEAVARLPERQRLALFLRYYADLDYGSIATALQITPGTVAATLNGAHANAFVFRTSR